MLGVRAGDLGPLLELDEHRADLDHQPIEHGRIR